MIGTTDVKNEVRKLASSKPVHAAAGVGAAATQVLRELPTRIADLHLETTVVTLPARANEVVQTARARVVDEYEKFASRGRKALGSGTESAGKGSAHGTGSGTTGSTSTSKVSTNGTSSRGTGSKSTGSRSTGSTSTGSTSSKSKAK